MNLKKQFSLLGKRGSSWWQNVWPLLVVFFFLLFPIILGINLLYFSGYLEPPPTVNRTEELFKGLMMGIALPAVFSAVAGSFFFLWGAIIDNSMNKVKSEDTVVVSLDNHFVSVLLRILTVWFVPFFLVLFGLSVVRGFSLMGTTQRVRGVVVSFAEIRNYRGDRLLAPCISFITSDGHPTEVTSRISSYSPRYQVGDEVMVMYRPSNPSAADIWSPTVLWFPALLTSGCFILVVAIIIVLRKKQRTG